MAPRVWALLYLASAARATPHSSFYDLEAEDLKSGLPVSFNYYRGRVVLIVNLASQCGYTAHTYTQLNELYAQYHELGLEILGFPCNQFGAQEPGSPGEIYQFATGTHGAQWDLFRKVDVNGPDAHPVYRWLRRAHESGGCVDDEPSCASWAATGECTANAAYMELHCRQSCGACAAAAAAASTPIGWNFESFVLNRRGELVTRWATGTELLGHEQREVIERLLGEDRPKDEL